MSESIPPSPSPDPNIQPVAANQTPPVASAAAPPPAPRKRRRRWPWVVGALLVLLVLLVVLVPTLVSSGVGRSIVVSQVNSRINGHLEIKDWSLGWTGGISADGIVINDASNRQILQIAHFSTKLGLLKAIRGKYDIGETRIEGLDVLVSREADGSLNWSHLAKSDGGKMETKPAEPSAPQSKETRVPDVSGELIVSNARVTYEDATRQSQPVYLRNIQADVKIPDINQPITDSLSADAQLGTAPPGTLSAGGVIAAVANNVVLTTPKQLDQMIKLNGLELSAVSSLLGKDAPANLVGRTDGQVVVNLNNGGGTVGVDVKSNRFGASGGKLADAVLTTDALTFLTSLKIQLPPEGQSLANAKVQLGDGKSTGVQLQIANMNLVQGTGAAARPVLKNDTLTFDAGGGYSADSSGRDVRLTQLKLLDSQGTFSVQKAADSDVVAHLPQTGSPTAQGGIDVAADLKKLNDIAQAFSAPQVTAKDPNGYELQSGKLAGRISLAQATADQIAVTGDLGVTQITVGNATSAPLKDQTIKVALKATANHDLSVVEPQVDVTGDLFTLKVSDTRLNLASPPPGATASAAPASAVQKLQKATVALEVPSLPKVQALVRAFSPPAAAKPASGVAMRPGPAIAWAGQRVPRGAVPAKPAAAAPATQPAEVPADVTSGSLSATFKADTAGSDLHLLPNVVLTNLGIKKGDATYALSSINIASDATVISTGDQVQEFRVVKADVDLNDLLVNSKAYPEKKLHLGAVASMLPAAHVLDLKSVVFQTPTTNALAATIQGKITELGAAQKIDNVLTADLNYDAGELLKLVVPLLSPDLQKRLNDAKASGKYQKRFEVRGAYPAGQPFNKAVQQLAAGGDIQVDGFEGAGVSLQNLDLPITLTGGFARIIYPNKPTGQNLPKAAGFNGGTLNLGGTQVDLREETPTLSTVGNLKLLDNAGLNPIFASWSLGTILANPMFVEPDKATGYLSITVVNCDQLPLSSELTTSKEGTVTLNLSLTQLSLVSGLIKNIGAVTHSNADGFQGDIPTYRITVHQGIVDQDLTMTLGQKQRPLRMFGKVRLSDKELLPLTIDLPWKLFGIKGVPRGFEKFLPEGIQLPMTGKLDNPQVSFDFNAVVRNAGLQNPAAVIPGILGNRNEPPPTTSESGGGGGSTTQPAKEDPMKAIQDLINQATQKKKKK